MPHQPVEGDGAARDLEVVGGDDVEHLVHLDQLPLAHLAVNVPRLEGLRELEVVDEEGVVVDAALGQVHRALESGG